MRTTAITEDSVPSGPRTRTKYQYDAESRLINYASGGAVYTYDASGNRVQKQANGTATEYIYFDGQPIAEYNPATQDWTDYIYASGRRIARDDTFSNELYITGTNSSTSQASVFGLASAGGLSGYTIQAGDKLSFYQYEWSGTEAGIGITFTDSTSTNWTATDQFGNYMNQMTATGTSEVRNVDLSAFAGKQIFSFNLVSEVGTAAEQWAASFLQISLVSADGTVHTIYNDNPSYGISLTWTTGATGISCGTINWHNRPNFHAVTVNYYHGDHLGSSRLMTTDSGWPIWSDTFLPFGEEWNPQFTLNTRKFTGKERDSESNLDNFGARYYTSSYGRFMTPDWDAKPTAVPYANFGNPQSLNLYSYVENNPTTMGDPDGHQDEDADAENYESTDDKAFEEKLEEAVRAKQANELADRVQALSPTPQQRASGWDDPEFKPGAACHAPGSPDPNAPSISSPGESQVEKNYAQGKAFQDAVAAKTAETDTDVVQNITIKTDSGTKTVMDVVSRDSSGNPRLQEAKSSDTAPLTPNQRATHPEIKRTGGTVVGRGKPGFPGGTKIPPTSVDVVRP
jgi:RHS repeat-associated protein